MQKISKKGSGAIVYLGICAVLLLATAVIAQSPARANVLDASLNEQVVMIPSGSGLFGVTLETTIFKPTGSGPFPVVVMNHGKAEGNPHFQPRARYLVLSREFVKRGYAVVIPMRKGFAGSSGGYVDGGCNVAGNGEAQADDVQTALDYVTAQPWADKSRLLIAGQSHGGLTTMAFGERTYPGVKGLINFAGGLRKESCQWQNALVDAFGTFGARTKLSSIWFYGENDSYFAPELAARLHAAFTKAGGKAKLVAYGPFKDDAHKTVSSSDGVSVWLPETEIFLKGIGMPTEVVFSLTSVPPTAPSSLAKVDDVSAAPPIKE